MVGPLTDRLTPGSSGIVLLSYVTLTLAATGCENVDCSSGALNVPNPIDCASFCQCSWGSGIYQPCPPGLHFNAQLQVCDWPESAQCNLNDPPTSTTEPPLTTTLPTEISTLPTEISTLPTETTTIRDTSGCENTHCPYLQIHMNLPHPYDCNSYCMCDYGKAVRRYCPAELHFSAELHVCDWPIRARCQIPNNNLPTVDFPTTEMPGCQTVDCPNNSGIELEPNPSSNSSFCVCIGGKIAIEVPCPQGTKFNSHRRTCDSEGTSVMPTTEGTTQTVELITDPQESSTSQESTMETTSYSETTKRSTTVMSTPPTIPHETTAFTTTIPPETTTPETTTLPPTESSTLHLYTTTTISTTIPSTIPNTISTTISTTTPTIISTTIPATTTTTKPPRTTTTEKPETCDDSMCKTGVEYARMPKFCWGICRCEGGRAITFHCPEKKVFNLQRHECEEPEEPCDD